MQNHTMANQHRIQAQSSMWELHDALKSIKETPEDVVNRAVSIWCDLLTFLTVISDMEKETNTSAKRLKIKYALTVAQDMQRGFLPVIDYVSSTACPPSSEVAMHASRARHALDCLVEELKRMDKDVWPKAEFVKERLKVMKEHCLEMIDKTDDLFWYWYDMPKNVKLAMCRVMNTCKLIAYLIWSVVDLPFNIEDVNPKMESMRISLRVTDQDMAVIVAYASSVGCKRSLRTGSILAKMMEAKGAMSSEFSSIWESKD